MMRHTKSWLLWGCCGKKAKARLDPRLSITAVDGRLTAELQRLRTEAYLQQVLGTVQTQTSEVHSLRERLVGFEHSLSAAVEQCKTDRGQPPSSSASVNAADDHSDVAWRERWEALKHEATVQTSELVSKLNEEGSRCVELQRRLDEQREEAADALQKLKESNPDQSSAIASLNTRLKDTMDVVLSRDKLISDLRSQVEELTKQLKMKTDEIEVLLHKVADAKAKLELAEENLNEASLNFKELEVHNASLSEDLTREGQAFKEENDRLRSQVADLLAQTARSGGREQELVKESAELTAQLVSTRVSLQERGAEAENLRAELGEARAEILRARAERDAAAAKLKAANEAEGSLSATVASLRAELANKASTDKRLAEEKERLWSAWRHIGGLAPPTVAKDPRDPDALHADERLTAVLRVLTGSLRRSPPSVDPEFVTLGALWYMLSAALERASAVVLADHVYTRRHCLENAVRCDPSLAPAWSELASVAGEGGMDFGETRISREALLIKAVECDWDSTDAWLNLAAHLVRLPTPKAEQRGAAGKAADLRLPTATLMGAKYSGRDILLKVLHSSPTNSRAWMLLGDSVCGAGSAPSQSHARSSESYVEVQGKRYSASQCYQQAILLDPTNAEAWTRLEGCVSHAGRTVADLLRKRWQTQWDRNRRCR